MVEGKIQSFPVSTWQREFSLARECGFELIEWVLDGVDPDRNPLFSPMGRAEINRLRRDCGIEVPSVCCDYFMDYPLQSEEWPTRTKALGVLVELLRVAPEIGIRYVELPLIGKAAVTAAGSGDRMVGLLNDMAAMAERTGVSLLLEVDLPPRPLWDLLQRMSSDHIGVNYDTGNSAYWGFKPEEEIPLYGTRIRNVHLKDCTPEKYSVFLGTGDVDFDLTFDLLNQCGYDGDFVLQAARGEDDCAIVRAFAQFCRPYLARMGK